jgi:hypothetical protein
MIGPAALRYLTKRFSTHDPSFEGIFSVLQVRATIIPGFADSNFDQIAFMKHFEEPLALFADDESFACSSPGRVEELLSSSSSFAFLDSLLARILSVQGSGKLEFADASIPNLFKSVSTAREIFYSQLLGLQRAYRCLRLIQTWLANHGYKSSATATVGGTAPPAVEVMIDVLTGKAEKEVKYIALAISCVTISSGALASLTPHLVNSRLRGSSYCLPRYMTFLSMHRRRYMSRNLTQLGISEKRIGKSSNMSSRGRLILHLNQGILEIRRWSKLHAHSAMQYRDS